MKIPHPMRSCLLVAAAAVAAAGCATAPPPLDPQAAAAGARAAETAFSQAMADRDFQAFSRFVADDAVFVNGGQPLRGKTAVLLHWQRFFERAQAPFTWKPEIVEVTSGGRIAYSEGPVTQANGRVTSRYFSTWRLEPDGRWRVVFDNGYALCDCAPAGEKKP